MVPRVLCSKEKRRPERWNQNKGRQCKPLRNNLEKHRLRWSCTRAVDAVYGVGGAGDDMGKGALDVSCHRILPSNEDVLDRCDILVDPTRLELQ